MKKSEIAQDLSERLKKLSDMPFNTQKDMTEWDIYTEDIFDFWHEHQNILPPLPELIIHYISDADIRSRDRTGEYKEAQERMFRDWIDRNLKSD